MKVLLCSPYKSGPDIVRGGINQWAKNILSYHKEHNDGIELIPVSFDRHVSLIHSKNAIQRFINGVREQISPLHKAIKTLKSAKPDVIHICTSAGMGCLRDLILVKFAKRHHIRSIMHLHFGRLPELSLNKNWEWRILKVVLNQCDVIVPMNKPTEASLYEEGFKNVKYLPNPLSKSLVDQINELKGTINRCPMHLLYVGHVYETKGVFELVEGCKNIEGIKLRIVGKYSQEIYNKLNSIADNTDKNTRIDFVGEIDHKEVIKEFMKADLFVFPSYTEGFPNVILEAMACGCPIIASNVGAIPEMLDIDNCSCGMCIQPKSSKEVHDAVTLLLNDKEQKELFSERAMRRVNTMYTMPVVWKELVNIWKS